MLFIECVLRATDTWWLVFYIDCVFLTTGNSVCVCCMSTLVSLCISCLSIGYGGVDLMSDGVVL